MIAMTPQSYPLHLTTPDRRYLVVAWWGDPTLGELLPVVVETGTTSKPRMLSRDGDGLYSLPLA